MESILNEIKNMLGGAAYNNNHFDVPIIASINSSIMTLNQIGVGISGFVVIDSTNTWEDFIGTRTDLWQIKNFIYFSARLDFDPPTNSFMIESINKRIDEIVWRLNVQVEQTVKEGD